MTMEDQTDRINAITVADLRKMLDCLLQWQSAAWTGDAYEYCNASNERDRILDELLGEDNASSRSDNTP